MKDLRAIRAVTDAVDVGTLCPVACAGVADVDYTVVIGPRGVCQWDSEWGRWKVNLRPVGAVCCTIGLCAKGPLLDILC